MLLEQDGSNRRMLGDRDGDVFREREPRTLPRNPERFVTEHALRELSPAWNGGERDGRVRMGVIDVSRREERVQQRLDRRPRRVRVERAAADVLEHFLVGHLVALEEEAQVVETERRESRLRDRREIGSRRLHPHDRHRATRMIDRESLHRRVAAALVGNRAVGPQEVRPANELLDVRNRKHRAATPPRPARRVVRSRPRG